MELISTETKFDLTPKGKKIKYNLTGLRAFLKEYSNMHEKSINELGLWDEYYICAVILGDNKKSLRELKKLQYNGKKIFRK